MEHTSKKYKVFEVIQFEKSLHDVLIINLRLDDDFLLHNKVEYNLNNS